MKHPNDSQVVFQWDSEELTLSWHKYCVTPYPSPLTKKDNCLMNVNGSRSGTPGFQGASVVQ